MSLPAKPPPEELIAALPEVLQALARRAAIVQFARRDLLIREGDLGDTLYIILAGRVRAYSRSEKGREVTYGSYGPGEYVGEMSLDGGPRSASVEAMEPTCSGMVTRRTLREHIAQHPDFAFELLAKVIRRARAATLSVRQLALNDVYGRLQEALRGLAVVQPDGTSRIEAPLTQRELAAMIGCSREMVSKLLKDLEKGRYVEWYDGRLTLRRSLPVRW